MTFTIGARQRPVLRRDRRARAARARADARRRSRRHGATSGAASTNDSQLRWLGPEKGVIHLATAAVVNAVWDLWAKSARASRCGSSSPTSTPEQFVDCVDFRYITDVAHAGRGRSTCSARLAPTKAARIAELRRDGYPAYTTSAGWLGYPEEKVRDLCRSVARRRVAQLQDQGRRRRRARTSGAATLMREEMGTDVQLMVDANQVWDVPQAIEWIEHLAPVRPAVDRGADEPRRRARPRRDPQGGRADRRGDRRARAQTA